MATKTIAAPRKSTPQPKRIRKAAVASLPQPVPKKIEAAATSAPEGKPRKQRAKLVRDSFTMPVSDFALVATLKARALGAQREAKKSELLRAGLHALSALDASSLVDALNRLEVMNRGRPRKSS